LRLYDKQYSISYCEEFKDKPVNEFFPEKILSRHKNSLIGKYPVCKLIV
jgi:hypothetical protein